MIPKLLTTKEVQAVSRHGETWVWAAANTGALQCQPGRRRGQKFLFTEAAVTDWINRGCPDVPAKRSRRTA